MPEPQPKQPSGFGATLKAKWGPLPVWGWLLLVTILALAYYLYEQHKQGGQQTAPVAGQPGVVVINQGTVPPAPDEDHDKDKDGKRKHHDDDDHHRHRKRHHRHHGDADLPVITAPVDTGAAMMPTGHAPGPPNVGAQFPKISPAAAEGGSAAGEGSGGEL